MRATILLINGAPSVGKSSLAEKLQETLDTPYLYLGVDAFVHLLPPKLISQSPNPGFQFKSRQDAHGHPVVDFLVGPLGEKLLDGYIACIQTLAKLEFSIIADSILTEKKWEEKINTQLQDFRVIKILLFAPLKELERREFATGELPGLARGRFDAVYRDDVHYDLKIDTSKVSIEDAAKQVESFLK